MSRVIVKCDEDRESENEEPRLGPAGAGFCIRLSLSDLVESEPHPAPYCYAGFYDQQSQVFTEVDDANGANEHDAW